MSAPVEFRFYYPKYQLSHLKQGLQNVRGPNGDIFLPPTLQYRYKMRIKTPTGIELEWCEWTEIPHVHEGVEPLPSSTASIPAAE